MDSRFHGVIAFPITTTDAQGKFAPEAFRGLIDYLIEGGVHGIGILASSGAGAYFSEEERKQIASATVKIINGRIPLMVGTGSMSTEQTVRLSQHAESIGADAVVIVPVSYWPLTQDEVYRHFESVSRAINIPISVYNNPRTTQVDILPETVGRLSSLPHLDTFKEIAIDLGRLDQIRQACGCKLSVAYGRDAYACEALIAGADAWQSGVAGVIPQHCVRIFNLVKKEKNYELARKYAAEIADFCKFCSEKGLIRAEHAALEMMGMAAGRPRPPVRALEGADAEALRQHLTGLGLIGQVTGVGTGRR